MKSKEFKADVFAILIGAIAALQFVLIATAMQQSKQNHCSLSAAQTLGKVTK